MKVESELQTQGVVYAKLCPGRHHSPFKELRESQKGCRVGNQERLTRGGISHPNSLSMLRRASDMITLLCGKPVPEERAS